jgi:GntR family transcriptional repressor for pyruvate dehydrogenase complex
VADDLRIEPVNRARLSRQIMVQICELIRDNRLAAGDRLPAERDLAERLQVSRASLREALTGLEAAGIITSRHGGGTYERNFHEVGVTSPLALALSATDDLVGDLWEMRVIFEPMVAAQAAVRATDGDIATIQRILDEHGALVEQYDHADASVSLDRQFHTAIAAASGNRVAVRVLQMINELLLEGRRHFAADRERSYRTWVRHTQITEAIRQHDPRAARDAMLTHLQDVELYIVGTLLAETIDDNRVPAFTPASGDGNGDDAYDHRVYSRRTVGPKRESDEADDEQHERERKGGKPGTA